MNKVFREMTDTIFFLLQPLSSSFHATSDPMSDSVRLLKSHKSSDGLAVNSELENE